jgi:hypothetical protein
MTISHKSLFLAAALLGFLIVATDSEARRIGGGRSSGASRTVAKPEAKNKGEKEEQTAGSSIKIRVRSEDSRNASGTPGQGQAMAAVQQPSGSTVPVAAAATAAVDEEERRRHNEDNLRRASEFEQKREAEKEKRAAAIAAWEQHQAEQRRREEQERAERSAKNRVRDTAGGCVYKAVMSDEDLARCRTASR